MQNPKETSAPLGSCYQPTKSFITDGYEAFTGIVEINATGNIWKRISGYEHPFRLVPRPVVIFGLEPVSIPKKSIDSGEEFKLWAEIYTPEGQSETCPAIYQILAQEKTHGFPHVAREAREFVLFRRAWCYRENVNTALFSAPLALIL